MDIKKKFSDFYNELNSILSEHGFTVSKTEENAIKKTNIGFSEILFNIEKMYDYTYSIDIKLWIRSDEIQNVRGKVTPKFNKLDSITIFSDVYGLVESFNRKELDFEASSGNVIDFDNNSSKDKWFSGFKNFMNEIGFPFFERFRSTEDFHQWFNKPVLDNDFAFEKSLNWNNSVCGLIAAKLVKSQDYEKIYTIRINDLIAKQKKEAIEELKKTKLYLDEHY